jgi:glycerol-1-phosphate dehydrogenase [NAD(P)+]
MIDIGRGASERFTDYCLGRKIESVHLVADSTTWRVLGQSVAARATGGGIKVGRTIFEDDRVVADASSVFRLFLDVGDIDCLLVAIGSGTITDITRFVAHRSRREFVSMPTAPSVDAYASVVAPLVVKEVKKTVPASAPVAIFADTGILAGAPPDMIAAGFGDVICKYSAIADWRLGALLWGESFEGEIAQRALDAADACARAAGAIGEAAEEGVATLMSALIDSGRCMAAAGNSHPASGAEHQYSHYWEMRLMREGRPPILHGLKVGIGTLIAASLWKRVGALSAEEAASLLSRSRLPRAEDERRAIMEAYGRDSEEIIKAHGKFLGMTDGDYRELCERIIANWEEVLRIARSVPSPVELESLLHAARCPTEASALGLSEVEVRAAIFNAHYIRDRFTVRKLSKMLWRED